MDKTHSSATAGTSASPVVEFALGSAVSPSHFSFKSDYARSVAETSVRDSKSLDFDFLDNGTIVEERNNDGNNNFYSLIDFFEQQSIQTWKHTDRRFSLQPSASCHGAIGERSTMMGFHGELEALRKKSQMLSMENERLREYLRSQQSNQGTAPTIDTVYLQNQVNTLHWQLKQAEASRDMYRSTMEQVAHFLDRSRKSLEILSEKLPPTKKSTAKEKSRVPRSRSVHAVHAVDPISGVGSAGSSASFASSTLSSCSSHSSTSTSSRFGRAKSVAQIPPSAAGDRNSTGSSFKDFTWSVLRRHADSPKTRPPPPPAAAQSPLGAAASEPAAYRRPKQPEYDPDQVPPEKLAQEAFRLLRTVQSLLAMREPNLARLDASQDVSASASASSSPLDQLDASSLSLHHNFVNSTTLQEAGSSSSDRGTEGSGSCYTDDEVNRGATLASDSASSEQTLLGPGARHSMDGSSFNSICSGKNVENVEGVEGAESVEIAGGVASVESAEGTGPEDRAFGVAREREGQRLGEAYGFGLGPSCPGPALGKKSKKIERKDRLKSLKDWAFGNSSGPLTSRPQPATSVSSAEDESGFSSMSSFQEVGLPHVASTPPVKGGCHTEVGLPEVPVEKVRHRRWSSTPAEFQALFKRHSGSFATAGQTSETFSVWV